MPSWLWVLIAVLAVILLIILIIQNVDVNVNDAYSLAKAMVTA